MARSRMENLVKKKKTTEDLREEQEHQKDRLTISLSMNLSNRLRNMAWHERTSLSAIVEESLRTYLDFAEKTHGGAYPSRGRPKLPKI